MASVESTTSSSLTEEDVKAKAVDSARAAPGVAEDGSSEEDMEAVEESWESWEEVWETWVFESEEEEGEWISYTEWVTEGGSSVSGEDLAEQPATSSTGGGKELSDDLSDDDVAHRGGRGCCIVA